MEFLSSNQHTLVYNVLSFGTAVMFGAFVYFLTQIKSVREEYRSGVAVSAVVVGIAGYHYYRIWSCLLYTSPSPRDRQKSRMPSSA